MSRVYLKSTKKQRIVLHNKEKREKLKQQRAIPIVKLNITKEMVKYFVNEFKEHKRSAEHLKSNTITGDYFLRSRKTN
tara:strand:- start:3118 stop:3351 length:234 start_codon:yes stop_codon:yes gene_type:complete